MTSKPTDIPAESGAKESVKKLRGSKLDAKKSADYESDLAHAHVWEATACSTWLVTGRVLPERCDVNVVAMTSHAVGAGGRFRLRIEVIRAHILAVCWSERGGVSVLEITEAVRSALAFPVDYIAYQNRGAYQLTWKEAAPTLGRLGVVGIGRGHCSDRARSL